MCFWHQISRRQNNENADQYLSWYHWLRLFSAIDFDDILVWLVLNTLWTKLQGKGSPSTNKKKKIPGLQVHFCAVFPCQICIGLHEIYSYVLLTKREGKSSFVAFLWTETKVEVRNNAEKPNVKGPNAITFRTLLHLGKSLHWGLQETTLIRNIRLHDWTLREIWMPHILTKTITRS